MKKEIREVEIEKDKNGGYEKVKIVFGSQYMVEIEAISGKVTLKLIYTHHGFKADATGEGDGELYRFIEEIRKNHPENNID